jgi:hypothetical protein
MSEKVPTTTSTPTTRILAIGTINPGVDQAKVFEILPNEVRETVNLYLDGKIDQWYSLQDRRGVVFILNVADPTVAHEMRVWSIYVAMLRNSFQQHHCTRWSEASIWPRTKISSTRLSQN